jgi:hypothetical protein
MALHIAAPSRFLGVGLGYSAKAVQLHGARLIERLSREICSLRGRHVRHEQTQRHVVLGEKH